jgi:ring-1,2-phenylacetyl-CoA epoxidase subunit PaaD
VVTAPAAATAAAEARRVVEAIPDPELPMLGLGDLGIVREVLIEEGKATVTITPTFLGCPALDHIRRTIRETLTHRGFASVAVETAYAPAWSVERISPVGRQKLREAGIAPPGEAAVCPRCSAPSARVVSSFGPTPCQAISACMECGEPFTVVRDP